MSYKENRVYLKDYASLSADSPLLAPIRTVEDGRDQQYVHHLLVEPFHAMDAACFAQTGIRLCVASGRRDPLWDTKEEYEAAMIKQYGSVAKGRKWRAFASGHQTGLCIDLLCGGLAPVSATAEEQKKTKLYKWLVANMWRWGFTPYFAEPWHLEYKVDLASYWAGMPSSSPAVASESVSTCADDNYVCEAPHDWVTV